MARTHYGRNAGSDTNGIFFNAAGGGTNYANQNSAQVSVADGVTGVSTTVTSASANFTTAMVGNGIYIAGGSGSLTGDWFEIASRTNSTTIVLTSATGSNGHALAVSTGVTLKVGGAASTSVPITPLIQAGDLVVWLPSDFSASGTVTISHAKCGSSNSTNWPMYYAGHASFATVANSGKLTSSSGYDKIVASDVSGATQLAQDNVVYAAATGVMECHLPIATLDSATDVVLYAWGGNANITTDISCHASVWDSNFVAVYHGGAGGSVNVTDSTANANNGTNHSTTASASGKLGGAMQFAASQYVDCGNGSSLQITGALTVQAWMYATSLSGYNAISAKTNGNTARPWDSYSVAGGGDLNFWVENDHAAFTSGISANTWAAIAMIYDGSVAKIIVNNSAGSSQAVTGPVQDSGTNMFLGTRGDFVTQMIGLLDEVRISKTNRSNDWITADYNNQSSPSTFYSQTGLSSGGGAVALIQPSCVGRVAVRRASFYSLRSL